MPLTVTTLPVKKCSGNDRSHFQNTNINIKISAENGRSATATTAACGRNREELLGPRPARCECRSKARSRCRVPQPEYIQRKIICYFEVQKNLRIFLNLFFTGGELTRQMPPLATTSFAIL